MRLNPPRWPLRLLAGLSCRAFFLVLTLQPQLRVPQDERRSIRRQFLPHSSYIGHLVTLLACQEAVRKEVALFCMPPVL
jgi:hypothetical protein